MLKSKALEINIASYNVDVEINPTYAPLQDVMAQYYGLMEGFNTFLKELSHPYKNWQFIVSEARGYALDYFHLLKDHPNGPAAAQLFIEILLDAIAATKDSKVRTDGVDNLLLYLQKISNEAGTNLDLFLPVLSQAFDKIRSFDNNYFFLFVKSYYQLKKLAALLLGRVADRSLDLTALKGLLLHYYDQAYSYWLKEEDPQPWFEKEAEKISDRTDLTRIFRPVSHAQINEWQTQLQKIASSDQDDSYVTVEQLLDLPSYNQIVDHYRSVPQQLAEAAPKKAQAHQWKVLGLFFIMNTSGLSLIHEETLREINRTLSWLIAHETHLNISYLIRKTFSILKARTNRYPATALNCILNMGKGVYKTDDSDLVQFFTDYAIDLGFQAPMLSGVGNDWQIKVNSAHILNIRAWLELIELNPAWSTRLLSYLTIHLSLCGVFIKDTDLFPRDITQLLNSQLDPVYNLAKQLARLFPVYFNDIGAEGQLRDISTKLDEITHRRDILIHFIRKQSHVESSNLIIPLMDAALDFWKTCDKTGLEPFVPPSIYNAIETSGPYIDGVHRVIAYLHRKGIDFPDDIIWLPEKDIQQLVSGAPDVASHDQVRVILAVAFYRLLHQKYNIDFFEMSSYIGQLKAEAFPDLAKLKAALDEPSLARKLHLLLDYLEMLKDLILSQQTFEVREDIYKKRHFTVDIPSMYGTYHDLKFDALGLTFRIESVVNVLFEELVEKVDFSLITKATFYQIYSHLKLFYRALRLDGIPSVEIERQIDMLAHSLEAHGFTFTQYLDIFKGFAQAVRNIINDYFNNIHGENLTHILEQISQDQILPKYHPRGEVPDPEKLIHRTSEIFFRDRIALSLGLQQLDRYLGRILNTLFQQSNKLPKDKLHDLLLYDPKNAMGAINDIPDRIRSIIYLGNKGWNMVKLHNLRMPVPPGFIITTEGFRCREIIDSYRPAENNFRDQVAEEIVKLEKTTCKRFGDPSNPLLFSVRSGSSISQPGMMDTFLDVGMNVEIATGIAEQTGNAWFAWDSYRRFLQCYGMALGLERDDFDAIISEMKRRAGVQFKKDFTGPQMRKVALTYKTMIKDFGIEILENPTDQLHLTIKNVFASWESAKARTFRRIMGISDDWGTAVTVQEMVYGNVSQQSGTGVFFTHNPRWSEDSLRLWGDFTVGNQGEDVASGLVNTLPISIIQQDIEMRETDVTLETDFPEIYSALKAWANELVHDHGWSPQEIEFTFESPSTQDLYILQARDMTIRERKQVWTFDPADTDPAQLLGHGIGVSGGALCGRIVFTLEEIDKWKKQDPDSPVILIRSDTVPDDIKEIFATDGLLTSRGGVTSHAAVVAHRLGKTCVVGCEEMRCNEKDKECRFAHTRIKSGDYISIDGREGSVYHGSICILRD